MRGLASGNSGARCTREGASMLRRLLRMGVGEVAGRSRQEASKWLERKSMGRTPPSGSAELFADLALPSVLARRECFSDLASAQQGVVDHFQAQAPARFFPGPGDAATPALFARLAPETRDRVIAAAEGVRLRRFDLLGYRGLSFGDPVDWHLDPVSGRRWPPVHWSLIAGLDAETVGDMKVVWELSRHQFLVTLGVAYRATGDERYAEAFAGLVRAWIEANPRGIGVNWAS